MLGPKHALARGIGRFAVDAAARVPKQHPNFDELWAAGWVPLSAIAEAERVAQDAIGKWVAQELQKPFNRAAPMAGLEQLAGDSWLFDRTKVGQAEADGV